MKVRDFCNDVRSLVGVGTISSSAMTYVYLHRSINSQTACARGHCKQRLKGRVLLFNALPHPSALSQRPQTSSPIAYFLRGVHGCFQRCRER